MCCLQNLDFTCLMSVFPCLMSVFPCLMSANTSPDVCFHQLQRLMEQRHLSERDSKLMIGAQMNMDKKVKLFRNWFPLIWLFCLLSLDSPCFVRLLMVAHFSLVIVVSCFKWLPWCSGSHGTVCDREQWITPRHTWAGKKEQRIHRKLSNCAFTGSEDPRKLVQILLPLESEVTAGSRHWRSLWYCLPRLQKGDQTTHKRSIWNQKQEFQDVRNLFGWDSPVWNISHVDRGDGGRRFSNNFVEEASPDDLS